MFPVYCAGSSIELREFKASDCQSIHQYASDMEVVKYELWGPNSEAQTQEFLKFAIRCQSEQPRQTFELAIIERKSNQLIGACGLRVKDAVHAEGDIGYTLRKESWGMGYGTEAAKLLIHFGFSNLKLHRIWATCHEENKASARVLEKAGMLREGLLRKNRLQRGEWRSSLLYAILENE